MSSSGGKEGRRLRLLCLGFVLYFILMVYCIQFAKTLPHQMLLLAAVVNMTVLITFVFTIKKAYLRMRSTTSPKGAASSEAGAQSHPETRGRLVALWIGAGLYSVAFIKGLAYGIAYAGRVPILILIIAEIINGSVLAVLLLAITKTYKRRNQRASPEP
jgi:hypothetical protein